ncbi:MULTISPECIES: hypothetical protein [Haloarcula]|uniref:hypothetical protein n=1 Tax=Haloarcula TaxID=2237 RepID=UPI0023E872C8|nr:hypothetical protein [Halomicroarcula sp. SHR3]
MSDTELLAALLEEPPEEVFENEQVRHEFDEALQEIAGSETDSDPDPPEDSEVTGQIVGDDTGDPLPWAVVESETTDGTAFASAGEDGTFMIASPTAGGSIRIVASQYEEEVVTVGADTDALGEIRLEPFSVPESEIEERYDDLGVEPPEEREYPPDEQNTATLESDSGDARVSVTGEGINPQLLGVEKEQPPAFETDAIDTTAASDIIHVWNERDIETGELEVGYDNSDVAGEEESLRIHRYDPAYQTFVALDSTVDTDAETVRAEFETSGLYAVFDPDQWEEKLRSTAPIPLDADGEPLTTTPEASRLGSYRRGEN